ncbi:MULTISPECIES: hypothetical protein [Burkholderia]|uniref:hypothetical protein n=1 Tax=Burkholderia TaxID=32008 RepID=UPI00051019CA|nr:MULTISPECIES: hypothetical protein [Burkholderia]KGC32109.1 hypothetical protein DO62_2415 [Burkholderia pseudomallei]KVC97402.1 hypothetical protein WI79_24735 [Burkholderia ubonensis]KVD72985.1 hypothetical protein WI89_13120 [Burkholderia ubonensis]KVG25282.1 hypothetical protein WJ29_00175 [Burkholderia ubonensis]KVH68476.1 hypothetical protein WJ41_22005 [Burkholderia ubonensis]
MSINRQPSAVVVRYDAEAKTLICNVVPEARVAPVTEGQLDIPVLLEEFNFKVDDEFARRFGGAILSVLAQYKPELAPYISITSPK